MVTTVRTCHVGDIPERIGPGGVLQRTARQRVCVTERISGSVRTLFLRGVQSRPVSALENRRIQSVWQKSVLLLLFILPAQILVRDSIEQTCPVYADGRFKPHLIITHLRLRKHTLIIGIDSRRLHRDLRITQRIRLTVIKAVAETIGIFMPFQHHAALVKRSFEWSHSMALRHTCKPVDIGLGRGIIHHQQISVARIISAERSVWPRLAMAVARMAVHARRAYVDRSQPSPHSAVVRHIIFKQLLAALERSKQSAALHTFCRLLECSRSGYERRAQLPACIIPLWAFVLFRIMRSGKIAGLFLFRGTCGHGRRRNDNGRQI